MVWGYVLKHHKMSWHVSKRISETNSKICHFHLAFPHFQISILDIHISLLYLHIFILHFHFPFASPHFHLEFFHFPSASTHFHLEFLHFHFAFPHFHIFKRKHWGRKSHSSVTHVECHGQLLPPEVTDLDSLRYGSLHIASDLKCTGQKRSHRKKI